MSKGNQLISSIKDAVKKAKQFVENGKSIPVIGVSDVSIDVGQLFDEKGNAIDHANIEDAKGGRFSGEIRIDQDLEELDGIESKVVRLDENNTFTIDSYPKDEGFKVSIDEPLKVSRI